MSTSYIPLDILVNNILERLPSKSLIRFRCVCKLWRDTIGSSSFIRAHHDRNAANPPTDYMLLVLYGTALRQYSLILSKDTSVSEAHLRFTHPQWTPLLMKIYGSSKGLVCISCHGLTLGSPIRIWNPSIGKSRITPTPPSSIYYKHFCEFYPPRISLSFGFHPDHNDYKAVRMLHFQEGTQRNIPLFEVEIYTLRTNSWKRIPITSLPPMLNSSINRLVGSAFLNGMAYLFLVKDSKYRILSFDTDREEFAQEVIAPSNISGYNDRPNILVWKESICICNLQLPDYSEGPPGFGKRIHDMWIMNSKEHSFEKLYTASTMVSLTVFYTLLGFSIDQDELVMKKSCKVGPMIVLYNFTSQQFHDTGIQLGLHEAEHVKITAGVCEHLYAGAYTDSLVLLDD